MEWKTPQNNDPQNYNYQICTKSEILENIKDETRNAMRSMCLGGYLEALPESCILVGPIMFMVLFQRVTLLLYIAKCSQP